MESEEHEEMATRVLRAAQFAKTEAPPGDHVKAVEILASLAARDSVVLSGVRAALLDTDFTSEASPLIDRIIEWAEREQKRSFH